MTMDIATLGIRVDATEARLAAVELDRLGAAGGRTATSMSSVERASKNLMGVFAGLGLGAFAKDILATNREMETLRASLKSVTGSATVATAAFNSIKDFAKNTPFEISGLTKTFITLQNMGIKPTQQVMEALTNQASKLGGSQETLTSIAMQLGQAHSKGKLQMEDMNVLMERGVPVMKLLGEVTGKNAAQLAEMSAKGTITNDVIDKLIIKMGEAAAGSNANAMDTLNGKISSLSDAWHDFEDTLMGDTSEGFIKKIVGNWTEWLDFFKDSIAGVGKEFAALEEINNKIVTSKAKISAMSQGGVAGAAWTVAGALTGNSVAGEENRLASFIKQREGIIKTTHDVIVAKNEEKAATDKLLNSASEEKKVLQESSEAKKAQEKAAKEAAKAQEALAKSFADTLESLSLHNIELSKTTREHKEAELSAKGYTQAMVAQAMAIYDIGTALEAKKKLHEAEKSELDSLIDKYNQLTLSARDYKLTQLNAQGITGTDQAPIMAQFDKNTGAETAKKAQEDAKTALDAYNSSLDAANTKTQDLGSITTAIFDGALGGISLMTGALTTMTDSLAENSKAMAELNKNQLLNNSIADPKEKAANFKKYAKEEAALNAKNVQDQMTGTRQVAMAASKMFSEKSAGAKAFHALSVSIDIAQQAMRIKDMAMSAVATAKNIAEGASKLFAQSGWLGFAGVAAMLALMAGLGAMSKGGGSGSSTPPPSDTGTGTVLGDPSAVSESIGKTNDLLKTIHASEYVELRGINRGVNTLKGAISTTLDHLFQAGGMANFQPIAPKAPSVLDQLNPMSGGGIGAVINTMRAVATGGLSIISDFIISKIPILGSIMSSINRFFFGGKVTQSVVGQGIGTNATSLQSVIDGGNVSGYQYADIKTHTSGGLFSKSKTRYSTQYQALSSDTQKSFNDIFSSVGDTIVSIAGTLGKSIETDLMPRVMSAVIPAMRVNLMGLSGEDASKKLNGVISAMMDTMTTQIFGDLVGKYQKLGEGMLETTVRIVSEIVIVQDALKQSGLKLLAADVIAVSDALVQAAGGLEAFQQQFEGYYDKFYSDSEKTARLNERLAGSLAEVGVKLADTREGYRLQIEALDMTNALDQQRYSTLLELSSAADTYYSSMESAAESLRKDMESAAESLRKVMDGLFSVEKISQQQTIINDFSKLLASALGFGANLGDVIKIWLAGLAGASKAIGDSLSTLLDGFISFNSGILTTKTSIGANISALGGSSSVGGQDYQQQVIDGLYAQLERSTTGADKLAVVGKLNTAIMARYNSELAMIGKVGTAIAGIKKYLESLKLSDKSPLTNMEKLNEARSQYNNILIKAKNGDQSALSSIQSSADAYLAEARNYYASSANYSEIFKNITDSLSQLANPAGMDQATYDAKVLELQAGSLSELQTLNNTLSDISIAEQAAYEKQNGILNASLAFLTNIANTNLTALNQPAVDMKNWAEQSMGRQLTSFESNWVSNQFNSRKAGADPSSIYTAAQPYVKTQGEITTALADVTNALGRTLTTWESDWINNQFMAGIDKATIYSQATAYINDKLSVNGSHANGLDFVPFDGYKAELHKGERVLTASQAKNDGVMSQELLMELKALRKEVERLRTDQHQQTGAIISSNYDANDKASDKVVDGTKAAAKQSVWANKSKAVIS